VKLHFLTADAARPEAPAHLLIHGMAGSATNWLDTIRPLTAHGRVIAPDLPGTLAGHTASPHRSAARAEINRLDPDLAIDPEDYFIIRHTGGTTGKSKGVAYTHRAWLAAGRD